MNRFEALNVLGLEEGASQQDVRLVYYGVRKAVETQDFTTNDRILMSVTAMRERVKEAHDFLIANGTQRNTGRTGGAIPQAFKRKGRQQPRLSITSEQDRRARLKGLEKLRVCLLNYRDHEASRRSTCLAVMLVCVVAGFIALRYVRAIPARITIFAAIAVAAVASSTGFTASHLQCRSARRYLLDIDARIRDLRVALGIEEPPSEEDERSGGIVGWFKRLWERVREWWRARREARALKEARATEALPEDAGAADRDCPDAAEDDGGADAGTGDDVDELFDDTFDDAPATDDDSVLEYDNEEDTDEDEAPDETKAPRRSTSSRKGTR